MDDDELECFIRGINRCVGSIEHEALIDWADEVLVSMGILDAVLTGYIELTGYGDDGPTFKMTSRGSSLVDESKIQEGWKDAES
jgi:hypothetical protein